MPDLAYYKIQNDRLLAQNQELKESVTRLEKCVDGRSMKVINDLRSDASVIQELLHSISKRLEGRYSTNGRVIALLIEDIYEIIDGGSK